ncbi:MAG: TolC family protein [Polyangiales bacterium]
MALVCVASSSMPAAALQPLSQFLARAKKWNPTNRQVTSVRKQRQAEITATRGRLLPSLTLEGVYTLNQFEAISEFPDGSGGVDRLTFVPRHQLDGYATLQVPIIDLRGLQNIETSRAHRAVAQESQAFTRLEVQRQVTRVYYELLGSEALERSAAENLKVAQDNAELVQKRMGQGEASNMDYQRALANVESAKQTLEDGKLAVVLKRRELRNLSGLRPAPVADFPIDDLHPEKPLAHWQRVRPDELPESRVARAQAKVATETHKSAGLAWSPTLSATAQERLTNATGFVGQSAVFTLMGVLSWRLDASLAADAQAADAAAQALRAQADDAEIRARMAVYEAWNRVKTGIAKSRAARAQVEATKRTRDLATIRYENGVTTQLDVVQAQRDAFDAVVARIRADVDLLYARKLLRIATGQTL